MINSKFLINSFPINIIFGNKNMKRIVFNAHSRVVASNLAL